MIKPLTKILLGPTLGIALLLNACDPLRNARSNNPEIYWCNLNDKTIAFDVNTAKPAGYKLLARNYITGEEFTLSYNQLRFRCQSERARLNSIPEDD